jgi:hypothetical protein
MKEKLLSHACAFLAGLSLILLSMTGLAQITEATLKLNVSDAQNSAINGSAIEIINEATNLKRTAVTDSDGQATVAGLPPGQYTVLIKATGFKTNSQRNLKLSVGQTTELKIQLTIGEVQEIVNIEATATQ